MRLADIQRSRTTVSEQMPVLASNEGQPPMVPFCLLRESPKRIFVRQIALGALQALQGHFKKRVGVDPPYPFDILCVGERFSRDASLTVFSRLTKGSPIRSVMVPGCSTAGEDVQFWLRRGVKHVAGTDLVDRQIVWQKAANRLENTFSARIEFRQSCIEKMPFADGSFDLVTSAAVLEHVGNLRAMTSETSRVLRPGGWAWHGIGPFYYTFGGDHAAPPSLEAGGYDHLLMDEPAYQRRIRDKALYRDDPDPNGRFWALHNIFSFAPSSEYLRFFSAHFEVKHLLVLICEKGLFFRQSYPEQWKTLLEAGVPEWDLLVKGFYIILRKCPREP